MKRTLQRVVVETVTGARAATTAVARHLLTSKPVPLSITVALTNRCQGSCSYCDIPQAGRKRERSAQWWIETLHALSRLGTYRLGFTGGEPLLYSEIDRVLAAARRLGMLVSMGTNGLLVPKRRDVISQLNYLVVSVDGPESVNDIQRFDGSYEAALEAIDVARSMHVPVWVTSVVTRSSIGRFADLLAWARRHDLRLNLQLPFHPAHYCGQDNLALFPDQDQIRTFLRQVRPHSGPRGVILNSRLYWRHVERWAAAGPDIVEKDSAHQALHSGRTPASRCLGGRLFFHIEPDGVVYPCTHQVGRFDGNQGDPEPELRGSLAHAGRRTCLTCLSSYAQEQNLLFSLRPGAVASWAAAIVPLLVPRSENRR